MVLPNQHCCRLCQSLCVSLLADVEEAYLTIFEIANTIWAAMVSRVGMTPAMLSAAFFSPSPVISIIVLLGFSALAASVFNDVEELYISSMLLTNVYLVFGDIGWT